MLLLVSLVLFVCCLFEVVLVICYLDIACLFAGGIVWLCKFCLSVMVSFACLIVRVFMLLVLFWVLVDVFWIGTCGYSYCLLISNVGIFG